MTEEEEDKELAEIGREFQMIIDGHPDFYLDLSILRAEKRPADGSDQRADEEE